MKRLLILWAIALTTTAAFGETVLICHAQSVPASLGPSFRSPLSASLVDGVFDFYFAKGDIAFDQPFSLADGVPTAAWLGNLSHTFGADRVVYFQVIWKAGDAKAAVLDRIDYQVVGSRGQVLADGSFTADLVSPSLEEAKGVKSVTDRILAGLAS